MQLPEEDILPLALAHNFWTWSAQKQVEPLVVTRAQGVFFWDADGKRYLDLNSMVMCANIGHGDPRMIQAITAQAGELAVAAPSMATRPRALLGRALAAITPGELNHFFYTTGGAEANENAVKFARAYTGRHKILTRYRSYHGATHGAIALTGDPRRWAWEPTVMPGVVHFLGPTAASMGGPEVSPAARCQRALEHLEEIITMEGPETIAAVMLEPVTGTNGILIPPDGYLSGVRALCDRYGLLLIADEVMSGFGRTGSWFAVDHWGVVPDIITMAKGLTSGYLPLGAVALRPEIAVHFDERVFHGGLTYNGHPLSLTAAVTNIDIMQQDGLLARARARGAFLARELHRLQAAHPSVGEVRCIGLFAALALVKDRESRTPLAPFNATSPPMAALRKRLLELGVFLVLHWDVVLIIPPLIISEAELQGGLEALDEALKITDAACA